MILKNVINQVILEDDCLNSINIYGDVKDLLNLIDECNCANDDPIKPLLEKSKTTICEMINQINTQSTLLSQYKCKSELFSRKLKQEIELSQQKDIDLNSFGNGALQILKEKEILESSLKQATEELNLCCSENKEYKCTISDLESKLCCVVKRLNNSQRENKINNEKCKYLTIENSKLQTKVKRFDEICKQCEDTIRSSEHQKLLYEDMNASLVKQKDVIEQKLKNLNNELTCTVNTSERNINHVKSELSCAQNNLKNSYEENQCLKETIITLECDIENLNKQLEQEKCENKNLVSLKSCLISEKDELELKNTRLFIIKLYLQVIPNNLFFINNVLFLNE